METGDDDDETLDPHADVDEKRDDEEAEWITADSPRPKRLRDEDVAQHEHPKNPAVRAESTIGHHVLLKNIAAVPRHECLNEIAVTDHQPGGEHDVRHVVQVTLGNEIFEVIDFPHRNHDVQHHGESGVDRARNKVGWKNG